MKPTTRCATLVTAFALFPLVAMAKLGGASEGSAAFHAIGPAGMKIDGTTKSVSVADDGNNVVITVPLNTLSTGIDLRDKHMKDKYLETGKYPNAELTVARSAIKFPDDGQSGSGNAPGTMKIHGKTHPVTVSYKASRGGTSYTVDGTTNVNMNDYGIETPGYLGVNVKPDVSINVHFKAQDN